MEFSKSKKKREIRMKPQIEIEQDMNNVVEREANGPGNKEENKVLKSNGKMEESDNKCRGRTYQNRKSKLCITQEIINLINKRREANKNTFNNK